MSCVIISGAGGFVGSSLTKKMIENGVRVIAISRHFSKDYPSSPLIQRIETNVTDVESLASLIPDEEYEAFYHFAWSGVNGEKKADPITQTENIKLAMICASVAKQHNCRKFLCSGTIAERSIESLNKLEQTSGGMIYGVAKHATHLMLECYCKNIGLDFIWMQFSNIFGPNNKTGNLVSYTLSEILSKKEASFGPANQPYDFLYIDDLLEAVYRLGFTKTHHNHYFIGSGKPRLLKAYLEKIGEACNRPQLIKIGARPDDGITYTMDMFSTNTLVADIGNYISHPFSDAIKYTIENY